MAEMFAQLPRRIMNKVQWLAARWGKRLRQQQQLSPTTTRAAFVFGVQRSGTNMLLDTLDNHLQTWVYNEDNSTAFDHYRIRSKPVRDTLLRRARAPWVVFKPNLDLQHADRLLREHPGSKGIWIYRHYADVTNSAMKRWGDDQQLVQIRRLAANTELEHWMVEDVPPRMIDLAQNFLAQDISNAAAGALKWYVRNSFLFELDLPTRFEQRLQVVRYEHLVTEPDAAFQQICDFLEIPFDPAMTADIFAGSVGKRPFPPIHPEIEQLCDDLLARLDALAIG